MGRDDNPDFDVRRLPGTRWAVFKDIFRNRFSVLVKLNFLTLLFLLPAVAVFVLSSMMKRTSAGYVPYSANFGIGWPVVPDAASIGARLAFQQTIMTYIILIPALMIASVGLAGAFHTVKLLVWGEGIAVTQAFLKGIKSNFKHFLWASLVLGFGILLVRFNMASYSLPDGNTGFLSTLALIASVLLLVLLIFMACYIFTQCVTYKLKFWPLIKNSFLFSIGLIFHNFFFILVLTGLPILLAFSIPMLGMILAMAYILIGVSFTVLVWTLLAQHVFDRFINEKVEGAVKYKGMYVMTSEEKAQARKEADEKRKKSANMRFVNPKRKKTVSIDEGATFTPLEATFSRADLRKLDEEKKRVKKEIETDEFMTDEEMAELESEPDNGQTDQDGETTE